MVGKSDMINASDYTTRIKSQFFTMTRFAEGLYKSLEGLNILDKGQHLDQGECWVAMYFILPPDLRAKVDASIKEALKEYESKVRDKV